MSLPGGDMGRMLSWGGSTVAAVALTGLWVRFLPSDPERQRVSVPLAPA